jgi:hypothetical protein
MGRRPVDVRFERRERDGGECDQPAITTAQLGILQDVRPAYRNFGLAYRDFGLYPIVPKGTRIRPRDGIDHVSASGRTTTFAYTYDDVG